MMVKLARNDDVLKNFILKYKKRSTDDLLRAILVQGNKDELMEWRTLCLVSNFNYIKDQAVKEVDLFRDISGKTYGDKIIEEAPAMENCMTVIKQF